MIVDSLMHRPLVSAEADTTVRDAARLMESRRVGCLIVTRGDDAVGLVTERDVVFRVVGAGRDPDATTLSDIMSAPIVSVTPDTSVDEAAALMKRLRIKRLVVMQDDEARGIISVTDIAYASPEATRTLLDAWVKQRWED